MKKVIYILLGIIIASTLTSCSEIKSNEINNKVAEKNIQKCEQQLKFYGENENWIIKLIINSEKTNNKKSEIQNNNPTNYSFEITYKGDVSRFKESQEIVIEYDGKAGITGKRKVYQPFEIKRINYDFNLENLPTDNESDLIYVTITLDRVSSKIELKCIK